jgi:hypothetical protein
MKSNLFALAVASAMGLLVASCVAQGEARAAEFNTPVIEGAGFMSQVEATCGLKYLPAIDEIVDGIYTTVDTDAEQAAITAGLDKFNAAVEKNGEQTACEMVYISSPESFR